MTIRVAVVGVAGRMGSTVCQAVQDAEGLELVARLDAGDTLDAEHLAGADVAVDFTVSDLYILMVFYPGDGFVEARRRWLELIRPGLLGHGE